MQNRIEDCKLRIIFFFKNLKRQRNLFQTTYLVFKNIFYQVKVLPACIKVFLQSSVKEDQTVIDLKSKIEVCWVTISIKRKKEEPVESNCFVFLMSFVLLEAYLLGLFCVDFQCHLHCELTGSLKERVIDNSNEINQDSSIQ